jgi:hypothetical protein
MARPITVLRVAASMMPSKPNPALSVLLATTATSGKPAPVMGRSRWHSGGSGWRPAGLPAVEAGLEGCALAGQQRRVVEEDAEAPACGHVP